MLSMPNVLREVEKIVNAIEEHCKTWLLKMKLHNLDLHCQD